MTFEEANKKAGATTPAKPTGKSVWDAANEAAKKATQQQPQVPAPVATAPAKSLLSKIGGALAGAAKATVGAVGDAASFVGNRVADNVKELNPYVQKFSDSAFKAVGGEAVTHPIQTFNKISEDVGANIDATLGNLFQSTEDFRSNVLDRKPDTSIAKSVNSTLNLLHAVAQVAFIPASETYDIASKLPVIKPAADAVGIIFDNAGKVTAFSADKLLQALPIQQKTKDELSSSVRNVSTLAGQVVLGGFIYEKITGGMNPEKVKKEAAQQAEDINHVNAWADLGKPKTMEEAKANYRKMAHEMHPDKPGGSTEAMSKVNQAFDILEKKGIPGKNLVKLAPEIKEKTAEKVEPKMIGADDVSAKVSTDLASGKSKNAIILDLSRKMGVDDARTLVEKVSLTTKPVESIAEPAPVPITPPRPNPEVAQAQSKLEEVNESILEKTPSEIQQHLVDVSTSVDSNVQELTKKVDALKQQLDNAPDRTAKKSQLKKQLSEAKTTLETAKGDMSRQMAEHSGSLRTFLTDYIPKQYDVPAEQVNEIINKVVSHITNAEAENITVQKAIVQEVTKLKEGGSPSPTDIDTNISWYKKTGGFDISPRGEHPAIRDLSAALKTKSGKEYAKSKVDEAIEKGELKVEGGKVTVYRAGEIGKDGLVSFTTDKEVAERFKAEAEDMGRSIDIIETKISPDDIAYYIGGGEAEVLVDPSHLKDLLPKEKTQKEKVKESVKKTPKSVKEVSEETGILEPNVRRILGMGAKEGTFERIEKGVYKVKTADGTEVAYILPADSVETLPKLAEEGFKADMVFLDIPYNTAAVRGGNRGVRYNLLSVDQFKTVMDAVSKIVKDEQSPVIYMYSQAASGMKDMKKYNAVLAETGFKEVARGEWQKLFQNGKPVTNVRGEVSKPEGILLLTKSGTFDKEIGNLSFRSERPKGYSTEKNADMMKELIVMTTAEGEIVLDPFAGSGVVPAEAVKSGRRTVAIEKNKEQAKKISERVEKAAQDKKYYIFNNEKYKYQEVKGKAIEIEEGIETFADKRDGKWNITEARSGALAGTGKSLAAAKRDAIKNFAEAKEKGIDVQKQIDRNIASHGVSPRYEVEAAAEDKSKLDKRVPAGMASTLTGNIGDYAKGAEKIGDYQTDAEATEQGLEPYKNYKLYEKVQELIEKYAKTIGQGYTPRGALGVFYTESKNIRINGLNDLSVASHEITHFLDHAFKISEKIMEVVGKTETGAPLYRSDTADVRKEMTELYEEYYPGGRADHPLKKRITEGFATLVQKYIEMPKTMQQKYPLLVSEFLEPEGEFYHKVMGEIEADLRKIVADYQGLSDLDKINARIVSGEVNVNKDDWLTRGDRIKTEVADNVYPIEKLAKLSGKHFTSADPSLWMRQYNNVNAIVVNNMKGDKGYWGWRKGDMVKLHDFNWKTLTERLASENKLEDFRAFLVARREHFAYKNVEELKLRVQELNRMASATQTLIDQLEEGDITEYVQKKNEFTTMAEEAKEEYERLEKVLRNDGFTRQEVDAAYLKNSERFIEEQDMFDKLTREDLNFLNDSEVQLLSPKDYERLSSQEGYASFKRQYYDELTGEETLPAAIKVGKVKVSSLMRRSGSQKPIIDPLYSAVANHSEITKKAMRQIVYNKMMDMAKDFPELFQELQLEAVPNGTGQMTFPQEKDQHIIMGRRNYKRVPVLTDNTVKQTIDELLTSQNVGWFVKIMTGASRIFTKGTTGLFPGFALSNVLIDQTSALALTRNNYIPIYSPLKELYEVIADKDSENHTFYDEYAMLGAERQTFVGWQDLTPNELQDAIRGEVDGITKTIDLITKGVDILAIPSKYSEIMTRATEYIKARKAGKPQIVAMEEAGRVTAPFHHVGRLGGGTYGKTYLKSIPFLNPMIQVLAQAAENIHSPKGRARYAWVTGAVTVALISSFAMLMKMATDEQKKLYTDLEPSEFAGYMWLPNPNGKSLIRLRVPQEIGVFGAVANMMLADMMMSADYSAGEYINAGTSWIPQQFNFTSPLKALLSWVPQIIKPGFLTAVGMKDYPNIRPLESQTQQSKEPGFRFTESTSPVAKFVGEKTNLSPIKIDYLLTGYLGRATGFVTGNKNAYNPFRAYNREYYFQSGRKIQNFYETKDTNEQQYHDYRNKIRDFTKEEIDGMLQSKSKIKNITTLLSRYGDLDLEKNPDQAKEIRDEILKRIDELNEEN